MVFVPAGPFEMGSQRTDDEMPVHTVTLDDFYIDQYEVTTTRFATFLNEQASVMDMSTLSSYIGNEDFYLRYDGGVWRVVKVYADYPIVWVSWRDARAYCEWRGGRLPTEAEWEKAARGTDERVYPWGWGIDCSVANYYHCVENGRTTDVGSHPAGASPYGAVNMAGNVREWVNDWYYKDYYSISPPDNPPGLDSGIIKVLRGGGWRSPQDFLYVTDRAAYAQVTFRNNDVGFRCAASAP